MAPNTFHVAHVNGRRLTEAAEAIHYGLLEAGYDSVLTTSLEQLHAFPDRRKVIFALRLDALLREHFPSADWREIIADRDIVYNPKQLRDDLVDRTYEIGEIIAERTIWDSSITNIRRLRKRDARQAVFVPLGYVDALRRIPRADYATDVMFFGRVTPRRERVLRALRESGLKCDFYDQHRRIWGRERDELIGRSRIIVNIYADDDKHFEAFRVSYLLTNGKCVVSENSEDPAESLYAEAAVFCDYDQIVETCGRYAADDRLLREREEIAVEMMRSLRQAAILHEVLAPASSDQTSAVY